MDSKYLKIVQNQGGKIPPDKYISIKNDARVFINDLINIAIIDSKGKFLSINKDGFEIVSLCNGRNTLSEIIDTINKKRTKKLKDDEKCKLNNFIYNLKYEHGIIEFEDVRALTEKELKIFDDCNFFPFRFHLELTTRCNLNCSFCYRGCDSSQELFMKDPILVLKDLKEKGTEIIEITGGEPLLHEDIIEILEFCVNNFLHIALLTNGSLLNNEIICFINEHKDKISLQIHLQSLEPKRYELITGINLLNIVMENIEILKKTDISYRIANVVIDEYSLDELDTIAKYAYNNHAKAFGVSPVINAGRSNEINNTQIFSKMLLEKVTSLYAKYGKFINLIEMDNEISHKKMNLNNCGVGFISMVIDPNENLRPCAFFNQYKSFERLDDIEYRKLFSKLPAPNSNDCIDCKYIDSCRGCIYNGFMKYQEIKNNCVWGEKYKLNEIIYD